MRVLIVEDEPKTVSYLRKGLSEEGYVVDYATDGPSGLELAESGRYDAIVLDGMLPELDGVELLTRLRCRYDTPVIMLTARDNLDHRLRGLQAGADDYLVKPFSFLELVARLRAITRRVRGHEETRLTVGDLTIDLLAHRALRGQRRITLTAKEFSLLALLAKRSGQIISKTVIAEMVWGITFDTSTNVVEVVVKRLRDKLELPTERKLLYTVRGLGYVLEDRESA